jgi:hypothetical protein
LTPRWGSRERSVSLPDWVRALKVDPADRRVVKEFESLRAMRQHFVVEMK